MATNSHPSLRRNAITESLMVLNWNRGRGEIDNWKVIPGGQGIAWRRYPMRKPDHFSFQVEDKEEPRRVTVRALGSTRTIEY